VLILDFSKQRLDIAKMIDARQAVLAPSGVPAGGALSLARLAFRTLSAVSPSLAARAAKRIWFTPPRPPLSPAAKAFLATGRRGNVFVNSRNVATWSWGEGLSVLLVHGWGGTAAQMAPFVEPLVAAGFRVVAFDAPAHGASGPSRFGKRQTTFFDFADAITTISRCIEPVAVIAHSGGCTSAAWAIRGGFRIPAAVFLAPMASPLRYKTMFQQALGISDEAMRRFSERTEKLLSFRWEELEMTGVPKVAETPRVLVVHDRDDRETSWREGASIAETWPNATLRTTEGLGHRRVLKDVATIEAVVEFVKGARAK
jgi:pimeloyl-ACP methyl ester carboxylesterase